MWAPSLMAPYASPTTDSASKDINVSSTQNAGCPPSRSPASQPGIQGARCLSTETEPLAKTSASVRQGRFQVTTDCPAWLPNLVTPPRVSRACSVQATLFRHWWRQEVSDVGMGGGSP